MEIKTLRLRNILDAKIRIGIHLFEQETEMLWYAEAYLCSVRHRAVRATTVRIDPGIFVEYCCRRFIWTSRWMSRKFGPLIAKGKNASRNKEFEDMRSSVILHSFPISSNKDVKL